VLSSSVLISTPSSFRVGCRLLSQQKTTWGTYVETAATNASVLCTCNVSTRASTQHARAHAPTHILCATYIRHNRRKTPQYRLPRQCYHNTAHGCPTAQQTNSLSVLENAKKKETESKIKKQKSRCRANSSQQHHTRMASLFPRRPCDALPFDGIIKFSSDSFDLLLFPVCSSSRGFPVTNCRCRRDCMHALRYSKEEEAQVS
jgi:hypothetical protein